MSREGEVEPKTIPADVRSPTRRPAAVGGRAPRGDDEVIHTDKWESGLRYAQKALSVKSVGRAKDFHDVVRVALQHNLRIDNEAHRHKSLPDPARTCLNTVLCGPVTPDEGGLQARLTFNRFGIAPSRRDNIAAIEVVMQPPDGGDRDEFWSECMAYVHGEFEHVLSAVVHRDQLRPHVHVIALAITRGKLGGAALSSCGNGLPVRQVRFTEHMRTTLGLRPDRPNQWAKRLANQQVGQEVAQTSSPRPPIAHASVHAQNAATLRESAALPAAPSPQLHQEPQRVEQSLTCDRPASAMGNDIEALHDQYLGHHFTCATCIAAGRRCDGSRCPVGLSLWHRYQHAVPPGGEFTTRPSTR